MKGLLSFVFISVSNTGNAVALEITAVNLLSSLKVIPYLLLRIASIAFFVCFKPKTKPEVFNILYSGLIVSK